MTLANQLIFGRDVQGINANAPQFPTVIFTATLAANTHKTITVPSDATTYIMYVTVQPAGYLWISRTNTAAIPASSSFAAATSEMVESQAEQYKRLVYAADSIDFLTPNTTCDVSVSFYAVTYP